MISNIYQNVLKMQLIKVDKSLDIRRADLPYPILVAHQPEFLPWLGNISKACMGDAYFILDTVQYGKELFQNRNKIRIRDGKGWQWLTIPVCNPNNKLLDWNEVYIDSKQHWKRKHLNAIQLSYGKCNYFNDIYPEIESLYTSFNSEKLIDFLVEFIKYAHKKFDIHVPIYRTSELMSIGYDISGQKSDLILNMCKVIDAKSFVFGQLGRNYIEKDKFSAVEYAFQKFTHPVYKQLHGEFISHMSFLDILFNHGKDAVSILNKSEYEKE